MLNWLVSLAYWINWVSISEVIKLLDYMWPLVFDSLLEAIFVSYQENISNKKTSIGTPCFVLVKLYMSFSTENFSLNYKSLTQAIYKFWVYMPQFIVHNSIKCFRNWEYIIHCMSVLCFKELQGLKVAI